MAASDNPIALRLDAVNKKRFEELKTYFENDLFLAFNVKNNNQMLNFIISEFMFLFMATNRTADKSYRSREKQLLENNKNNDEQIAIRKKLQQLDINDVKLKYLLLSIYNRNAGTLGEGGSIFSPGSLNHNVEEELEQIIEEDFRSNKLRKNS
ncbi:hypothetical protein [Lactiplantibacillus plantarum]|uniref:hypothetical protein n=1 Tax=Lactiplantibacillus plantarum TaxID=1590 RepID=UPI000976C1FB|nr:hypothetical protein [Lactiplantibacillus plantarum]